MKQLKWRTVNPEETKAIAKLTASFAEPGDVLTLEGDLGAGKTTFTKGFAEGLGITRVVNSPTFTIIKEYNEGTLPLYHMDVYRMEDESEDLGLDEYFHGQGVCLVEWAHLIEEQLPQERLQIVIKRAGDDEREMTFTAVGNRYEMLCEEISRHDNISD
ncbi:tRNA (adenosine(37)-N6)-threonylcarbamoyltransferase complex ATPase subunit type 1 TsaE [Bacillus inaquosorum]|uniref:tRNA (adenosine(37)-N6)-threonylcarbamoyltransferase complex ATPase subunit type 1 TsaE n=1 Tax=Bacillus inaquosorum TaxID=483913 RepID=UPI00227DDB7B|nr:tRNA (adenosine(37)-N6)-threonylcarbamoyltransferase complex ATPase subunit type 1 TsaE [Bacillus inaquosorum]MCY8176105.1 tRNA (adenosine(37)-N6)-threonylcarbamoyltransferase complex ATPase subunit type 1 TsaE [Bacillus inaquosorum]MCY8790715.1 tRNA (adenosine(37)-N6)-threonylcarbamoyltransferase complex ATPase subunit type 1 TsaE [Bacillus inaquosorum]MCY8846967.1 tRNA (adenosine(37)-N6)-threonylcarbamoyltransferase complex ATPase subunit type 1 TsaE [Bacillus inaquosorum]MCY9087498.1 tRNA